MNFKVMDKAAKLKEIEKTFGDGQIDRLDGITVSYPDWWFNVRPSNTEPLLRMNLEAADPAAVKARLADLTKILGTPVEH
jgi:phosphomannomutase